MKSLKVKDLKVKNGYGKVEYIIYDKDIDRSYLACLKFIPLKLFAKLHGEEYVVSFKYYDNTKSVSIITCKDEVECWGEDKNVVLKMPTIPKERKNEI